MLSALRRKFEPYKLSKFVRSEAPLVQLPPKNAILADVLKGLEIRLQNRELLRRATPQSFNPIWFLCETERNIFLWRNGFSIIEQDEFEFWIDIRKLISKRLNQLERFEQEDNPFLNPLWGNAVMDKALAEQEAEYLINFLEIFQKAEAHACAISHVGHHLRKESAGGETKIVVLPAGPEKPPQE